MSELDIKSQVEQAIEEFGERAHERFMVEQLPITSNKHLSLLLEFNSSLRLKPTHALVAHDIEVYGKQAYLMWEAEETHYSLRTVWLPATSNKNLLQHYKTNPEWYKRKPSAALPFDLDRAKDGAVVESKYGVTCKFIHEYETTGLQRVCVHFEGDSQNSLESITELRMRYPETKKGEL